MLIASLITGAVMTSEGTFQALPHPRGYVCLRAPTAPEFSGDLEDGAWKRADWTSDFVDIEGDQGPKPELRTRVKMLWDDQFLYLGAELQEPHVWATLTEHDSVIFQDNDFEVFVDPDGDSWSYFEYEINALGTDWDLYLPRPYRDGGSAMNAWEIEGLKKKVTVRGTINDPSDKDQGWVVELAIPWTAFRSPQGTPPVAHGRPKPGEAWRMNFSRVEWSLEVSGNRTTKIAGKPEKNWVWSPQWAIDMHRPELWGYVRFSSRTRDAEPFSTDSEWPARAVLHEIYYAQRDFREKRGAFAASLAQLGFGDIPEFEEVAAELTVLERGYKATVRTPSGFLEMSEDSRVVRRSAR